MFFSGKKIAVIGASYLQLPLVLKARELGIEVINEVEMAYRLLPKDVDMTKWSVIACDQYTSNKAYWEDGCQVSSKVADGMLEEIDKVDLFDDIGAKCYKNPKVRAI